MDPFCVAFSSLRSACSAISPSSCSPPLSSGDADRETSSSASEEVMALYLCLPTVRECATQHLARAIGRDTQMPISFPAWDKRSTAPNESRSRNATLVLGCRKPGVPLPWPSALRGGAEEAGCNRIAGSCTTMKWEGVGSKVDQGRVESDRWRNERFWERRGRAGSITRRLIGSFGKCAA